MHDRHYATAPATFADYRWRLQLLAEEAVGRAARDEGRREDAAFAAVRDALP